MTECVPTYATRRRPERRTYGSEIVSVARKLGTPPMPWQRYAADLLGEIHPITGLPAYRDIFITVPRQSGKTTIYLSVQIHRCLAPRWAHPQRSLYSAHTGKDARDKWVHELFPMIEKSEIAPFLDGRPRTGMGNEYVKFRTGSMIMLVSSSSSIGHGKTAHQAAVDEIWHDSDYTREQGIRPTMTTINDAQILNCSTAGTEVSIVYNQKVKAGRKAVEDDLGHGLAYIEYSAPGGVDWDPDDEESYFTFMPALCPNPRYDSDGCVCAPNGEWRHTIGLSTIRTERQSLPTSEFMRAYGNVPSTAHDDRTIPQKAWEGVQDPSAAPAGELLFGVDAPDERDTAAIVSLGENKDLELIEYRPGVGWLVDRALDLYERWDGKFVIDKSGPIGYLVEDFKRAGIPVVGLTQEDFMQGCGRIYDDIADQKLAVRSSGRYWPVLDEAAKGLGARHTGDRRVWSRSMSTSDASPFIAATLAWSQSSVAEPFFVP